MTSLRDDQLDHQEAPSGDEEDRPSEKPAEHTVGEVRGEQKVPEGGAVASREPSADSGSSGKPAEPGGPEEPERPVRLAAPEEIPDEDEEDGGEDGEEGEVGGGDEEIAEPSRQGLTPREARRVRAITAGVFMVCIAAAFVVQLGSQLSLMTVAVFGVGLVLSGVAIKLSYAARTRLAMAVLAVALGLVVTEQLLRLL